MEGTGFSISLKGLIVGGTLIIPGVSGGTMAMILGIYDRLIHAISSFRENPLENAKLLIKFAIGGTLGSPTKSVTERRVHTPKRTIPFTLRLYQKRSGKFLIRNPH